MTVGKGKRPRDPNQLAKQVFDSTQRASRRCCTAFRAEQTAPFHGLTRSATRLETSTALPQAVARLAVPSATGWFSS